MIVLIAISERQVVSEFSTTPVSGRMGIFARANLPTELKPTFEIVGCYETLDLANAHREHHFRSHPNCRYSQKVCDVTALPPGAQPNLDIRCVMCQTSIPAGSFCGGCEAKRIAELRRIDPELPDEPEPIHFADVGASSLYASRPPVWSDR